MNYLKIAKQITTEAHRGQKRKYNGDVVFMAIL